MPSETARGRGRTLDLPADLAFAGEAWSWICDALPLVTADSTLEPRRLAELMHLGFFSASDDADADSPETQAVRFDEEALHIATRLLCSEDSALELTIAETVRRELFWLVPNTPQGGGSPSPARTSGSPWAIPPKPPPEPAGRRSAFAAAGISPIPDRIAPAPPGAEAGRFRARGGRDAGAAVAHERPEP